MFRSDDNECMYPYLYTLCFLVLWLLAAGDLAFGQASLSVTPAYSYITEEAPHGAFALHNDGTELLEVVVSTRFGVIEADAEGTSTHVSLGTAGMLGNLAERLTFFPERLILEPGAERVVRFLIERPRESAEGAHIALMHFTMRERAVVKDGQVPAVATALDIVYTLVAPVVLIHGRGTPTLRADVLDTGATMLRLLLTNDTPFPFMGGVSVVGVLGERIGRAESAVYTRRRLEIPLSEAVTGGRITLEFDNSYTGLPAVVKERFAVPASIELSL